MKSFRNINNYMKKTLLLVLFFTLSTILIGCDANEKTDPDTITVSFDTGVEGQTIEPIIGIPGRNFDAPDDPVREGFAFTGWADENGIEFSGKTFPRKSITVYALWTSLDEMPEYKIEFLTNSNEYLEPIYFREGEIIEDLPGLSFYETEEFKFSFRRWTYDSEKFDMEVMPNHNLVLVAEWYKGTSAIYFSPETGIEPIVREVGQEIDAPEVLLTKENHMFMGWTRNNLPYVFTNMPTQSVTLEPKWFELTGTYNETTSLPKMFIELENNRDITSVDKYNYVYSTITLMDEDSNTEVLSNTAQFKGRGNGSWFASGPKRGYRIKFDDKQKLFDEQKSKHWVLLAGANFYDTTLLKTKTAFDLADEVFTNLEYVSSANFVELYVNGEYRGIYILAEHIRVANERVEIESEFGILDTGYFIEYDAYADQSLYGVDYFTVEGYRYGFSIKSPDSDDYLEEGLTEYQFKQQVAYIEDYTTRTLQAALNAPNDPTQYDIFLENVDINSFIDMYILHELFKNTDTGFSSFFMYKKTGGKLYAGPPWDFDAVAGNNRGNQTPQGIYVAGSVSYESEHTASELYIALMQVPEFQQAVQTRYIEIYDQILTFIDTNISETFITENQEAFSKNFYFWSVNRNIDGMVGTEYKTYGSILAAETGWASDVNILKQWLKTRATWLKNEWS